MRKAVYFVLILTAFLCGSALGQTVSSTLMGTVTDPANAVIPGVQVLLTAQATGTERVTTTDSAGLFRFPNLVPGAYSITIKATGFKTWGLKDINLSTAETRDVGRVTLEIGSLAEQIEVTAEATPIQTASSEKSALVDSTQLVRLALKNRDVFSFMQLLPGVLDTNTGRETIGTGGDGGISVNGNTTSMTNLVDGIADRDVGAASGVHFVPNMDAVGEVRLLASNYQAEFGRNSGGVVTIVTKSGTRDFHGTASWVHRHEQLNANKWENNVASAPRPRYRYNIFTWSLGGPAYIPGKFNPEKSKYFFFASQEFIRMFVPSGLRKQTMPTATEINGDFSNSLQSNGNLIVIKDPANNMTPFSGNQIPSNRWNSIGRAMLNFLPRPNYTPAVGSSDYRQYNFTDEASYKRPVSNTVIRGDVYLTSKLSGYFRYARNHDQNDAHYQGIQWSQSTTKQGASMAENHTNPGGGEVATITYVFTPYTLNSFTFGHSFNNWTYWAQDASLLDRSLVGNVPWLYPTKTLGTSLDSPADIDQMHPFLPNFSFGGGSRPNPGSFSLGTWGAAYFNWNDIWVFQDNFTRIVGRHSIKAGVYAEQPIKTQPVNNNWNGAYSFNHDANNPISSGDGFANGLLGNFTTYNEANFRPLLMGKYWNLDFYVQDNWRATRRLTLDFGIRLVHQESQYDPNHTFAAFDPSLYSASKMPRMYQPYCDVSFTGTSCPSGHRFGRDTVTGALVPAANIGLFVPNTGDAATGMQVLGVNGVSKYAYSMRSIAPGPRVGFAWDVLGNGKMSIRGGFGIVYDRLKGDEVYQMSGVPPVAYAPTVYYSTISALSAGGATGLLGPTGINPSLYGDVPFTRVQNASLSVQRALRGGMVLEVGYVGNWGYHLPFGQGTNGNDINYVPLGARFSNIDPTTGSPLSDNLIRTKYPGYSNIRRTWLGGHSSYHGLQTSLQRRYSNGVAFGVSYTFSKSMGTTSYNEVVPDYEKFYYGPNGNYRKNIFAFNYSYDIPNLGRRLDNKVLGVFTDHYTLSGITTAQSGAPYTPSCNSQSSVDITGTPNGTYRCLVLGDPKQGMQPGEIYNPRVLVLPPVGSVGNLSNNPLSLPGWSNWDVILTKAIPVGLGEGRMFKLAVQAYNAFNQAEFSGFGTSASFTRVFDPASLVSSTSLARPTSTRPSRVIATSLRFEF